MPVGTTLTLPQAAKLLKRDQEEVIRLCRVGRLRAWRRFGSWRIDTSSAHSFLLAATAGGPWGVYDARLDLSLSHIRSTDLGEEWVPDILRHRDQLQHADALLEEAAELLKSQSFGSPRVVEVPKTPTFSRSGKLISLPEMLALDAVVSSFAEAVDHALEPSVFSSRVASSPRHLLRNGAQQWVQWQEAVRKRARMSDTWLVKTDLVSFFDTINHDFLEADLQAIGTSASTRRQVMAMVKAWSTVPGTGLLQGPNAARVLGNLFLAPIDAVMSREGIDYFRFMDDIQIVAENQKSAIAALRLLESECRARGLVLSSSKTEVIRFSDEPIDRNAEKRNLAQYALRLGRVASARSILHAIAESSLGPEGSSNTDVRFSLLRLSRLRDKRLLPRILANLDSLSPHAPLIAEYLRPHLDSRSVRRELSDYFNSSDSIEHPHLVFFLFALMMEAPGPIPSEWVDSARKVMNDKRAAAHLRTAAANVCARGRKIGDINDLREGARNDLDKHLVRGFLVALARVGSLDRATRVAASRHGAHMIRTINFLETTKSLPSLTSGQNIPMRRF